MFGRKQQPARIDGYDLQSPAGWFPLPLHQTDPGWVDALVAEAAVEGGAEVLREQAPRVAEEVGRSDAFAAAVWVPAAPTGEIRGVLGLSFVQAEDGVPFTPEQLGQAIDTAQRPGLTVHSGDTHLMELAAGDSVLRREIVSSGEDGAVEERIVFTVFPPGAGEALELSFVSPHLELGEELAADAEAIAMSLTIELA